MKAPYYLLIAVLLLPGCGSRLFGSGSWQSLEDGITECVDSAWADVLGTSRGGRGGGGNSSAQASEWHYRLELSDKEMAKRMSTLRQLLLTRLSKEGANVHGQGSTGTAEDLVGFSLDYTSSDEEGMVWATRLGDGDKKHLIILWHGVNIR